VKKTIAISFVSAFALQVYGADLGTISVESSTIDVKEDLQTESSSVGFVNEETMELVNPQNLIDVLKTVPGVTAIARSGEMFQIRMRGVGQQQYMGEKPGVAIIVDGVPVAADAGGIRLNLQEIKNIKVIKGSASYLYGDTALAGAIVITTKKNRVKNESLVKLVAGSYGYKEAIVGTTYSTQNYSININGNYRKTDGYWKDAELWTKSLNGKASYYVDDTSDLTFGFDVADKYDQGGTRSNVAGVTAALQNPKGEPNTGYTKDSGIDLDKYFLSYNKDFANNSHLTVTGYYYNDLYAQISNPQDIDEDPNTPNIYVKEGNEDLVQKGVKAEYTTNGERFASLLGLEYGLREQINKSKTLADYTSYNSRKRAYENYYAGETSATNNEESVAAVYAELKYNISKAFTLTTNARYNKQQKDYINDSYEFDGSTWSNEHTVDTREFENTAYRVGATYEFAKAATLYANFSTGYETPDVTDLIETPDLKDQTSSTYELGLRGAASILFYDLSIFEMKNKDILGPSGGTYAFGEEMDNIGDSRHRGLELSLKTDPSKMFSMNLAYTYLDVVYTKHNIQTLLDDYTTRTYNDYDIVGNELPRVSKHTLDLFINYAATQNLKFITEIYAKSKYYADETNIVEMPGYAFVNLQAQYHFSYKKNLFEFFVKADNILDKNYFRSSFLHSDKRAPIGVDEDDVSITVDPGRILYAGLKCTF